MEKIYIYLKRFQSLDPPGREIKEALRKSISEVVGVDVPLKDITYTNYTAHLRVSAVVKAELFIKRQKFQNALHNHIGARSIRVS